jgi:hypothetical protein
VTDGADDVRRAFMDALQPVAAALGATLVDAEDVDGADIPLRWDGRLLGGLRVPPDVLRGSDGGLHGALGRMIEQVEDELGARLPDLSREDKQRAVRLLDERGAFLLRRSVDDVADALGVSRITVYNYLHALRP